MLDKLRDQALALIAITPQCTLSTAGPAGLQASIVDCVVCDHCVYVLIPSTADHLFNLEFEVEAMVTAPGWQLRGAALVIGAAARRRGGALDAIVERAGASGRRVIEIFPIRMHVEPAGAQRYRTTIDFDLHPPMAEHDRSLG